MEFICLQKILKGRNDILSSAYKFASPQAEIHIEHTETANQARIKALHGKDDRIIIYLWD